MDDYELSLLVLLGNAERIVALRGVDRAYHSLILQRIARYLGQIDQEMGHLRRLRLGAIGELQYAAERAMSPRERGVRAAQTRLRFAERLLLRLATYRRDLIERRAELKVEERYRI